MKRKTHHHLTWAHPLVAEWFESQIGAPTEPQAQGWPSILAKKSTLISAPTGSGKTFAAFLTCIDQLVRKALAGKLQDQTEVLYISPLKALSNDIQKNLMRPLHEIAELAKSKDMKMQEIRVAVRTGDTPSHERQTMLRKPPHILVTTPESFYLLLTAEKSRAIIKSTHTVIVDEIHALADDKRGAHLALSLERLSALTKNNFIRIGLSATQKPIELIGQFLVGSNRKLPTLVNIGHARHLDLAIEVPGSELAPVASNEMWDEIYDRVAELSNENRSTLVFVNTRRLAERVAHHLAERIGEENVAAHHGSLSRKLRLVAETKLKNGELKVLVATASLELGIDIGSVDLVCQLGSPKAIAVCLQRIGRAGHWHGAISKGRIFVTTRDELVECAALIYAIRQGDLDELIIPPQPIDILAQQIVATCATEDWQIDKLFALITNAYPYANLSREIFNNVIEMLAEGVAGSRGRYGAYLFYDRVNKIVKARRGSRIIAITCGGAIPENGLFTVIAEPQGTMVGTLDEDFAVESNRGDIILLGNTSWRIRRVEGNAGRVLVEDAHGAPPSVPFWRGEAPGRTKELSWHVANLRQILDEKLKSKIVTIHTEQRSSEVIETIDWLIKNTGVDQSGAEQVIEYLLQGRAILGAVPSQKTIIAERFFDEGGGMQLVIHAPFGSRINKAWGLALRKRFCRSFNFELQAAATDDGLNIALAEQHSFPLADVFQFLHPNTLKEVLIQAVLPAPLFTTRFRWCATRSLALPRFRFGKKIPPNILRILADDLLAAVFPDAAACQDNLAGRDIELPDHPLINETMQDTLTEALDVDGLMKVITDMIDGKINCIAVDTPLPSTFSHEILNANPYAYLDDAPLEERRARAVEMRRVLPSTILQEVGKLDPQAIKDVREQCWPDIRQEDELHDLLQTCIVLPEIFDLPANPHSIQDWQPYFQALVNQNRAGSALINDKRFWFCVDKRQTLQAIYPDAIIPQNLPDISQANPAQDEAIVIMLRGFLQHLGPITARELSQLLSLREADVNAALLKLESTGAILRGQFTYVFENDIEWCDRRLLARIHKLTLGSLRKEIEPVTSSQFIRWLLKWQHLVSESKLQGEHGLIEAIRQLQGFEIPAKLWEKQILAKRVKDYDPRELDRLCLIGAIGWGRLSPHPATLIEPENEHGKKRRVIPTSVAPITFFVREEADWMGKSRRADEELSGLSHIAKAVYQYLLQKGASFFSDMERGVPHLKAEIEDALWELVAAGLITADGFDNLRALIEPKRRTGRSGRHRKPRYSTGRWSVLHREDAIDQAKQIEATCWMLLKRYGVVFRDLLVREKNIPRWRDLLIAFRRLEDRGEIRGGRFVSGFLGEQFALPYAVDSLRAIKKQVANDETITISTADPLNLVGIILPGERISTLSGKTIQLQNGALL